LAYTLLLLVCFIPELRWGYWLPTVGTSALLLCGYCLMARVLSLLPCNRLEPLSLDLIRRTVFRPPVIARLELRSACGELNGVCELESRVALFETRGARIVLPPASHPPMTISSESTTATVGHRMK
jgi:hypothetical protein